MPDENVFGATFILMNLSTSDTKSPPPELTGNFSNLGIVMRINDLVFVMSKRILNFQRRTPECYQKNTDKLKNSSKSVRVL